MIVEMKRKASREDIEGVIAKATSMGFGYQLNLGTDKSVVAILGDRTGQIETDHFAVLPGVERVIRIMRPFKLAAREFHPDDTTVALPNCEVGAEALTMMAGPCTIETFDQAMETARVVKEAGVGVLRAGTRKPRTSPFKFRGLSLHESLDILEAIKKETGLAVVSEVVEVNNVDLVAEHVDLIQIGARNMQNYDLLEAAGKAGLPVLLKRGLAATIEEWLQAADYILSTDNPNVILCERGIRTFETATRFTLDVGAVPVVKKLSHLPIIIDPSHAAGYSEFVGALAKAGVAAGADGLLVEVHPSPKDALVDGSQSLTFARFRALVEELKPIACAVGRDL
ncbi:MAG: 3-deoxy-7-phosphoheptulonate synthase [Armatimonadetes bacterium]|nr:3-deoxy-7-phosphoheptulonate synthase [Armatimonadota bacterium]